MPSVNGKKFPYTASGKSAAKKALKAMVRSKVKDGMGGPGAFSTLGKVAKFAVDPTGLGRKIGNKIVQKVKDKMEPQYKKDARQMKNIANAENAALDRGIPVTLSRANRLPIKITPGADGSRPRVMEAPQAKPEAMNQAQQAPKMPMKPMMQQMPKTMKPMMKQMPKMPNTMPMQKMPNIMKMPKTPDQMPPMKKKALLKGVLGQYK